jgi:Flp pilus assembly protein TadD
VTRAGTQDRKRRRAGRRWSGSLPWAIILLAAVTGAVYYNSLQNEFLFDDLETIVSVQRPGGPGGFGGVLRLIRGQPQYRPIRSASYAFDYAVSGLQPWGYHLSNIAYHGLAAIFVFLIAHTLFDRLGAALFAALLFAVHPIQTEAVTYLSGRRDLLSGLFVLAGFYAFLRYRGTGRPTYLGLALLAYPLAFLSKESGVILPALCFGYDVIARTRITAPGVGPRLLRDLWVGTRGAFSQSRLLYLPFVVLAAGATYYVLFLVRGTPQRAYHGGSLWFSLLTQARVVLYYIKLLIFPVTLNADYSYNAFPVTTSWTDPKALASLAILAALVYGLIGCLRTRPIAAFGGAWFFIALLPVSQIIPHHEMMAEHFLYLPSVGFFLFVAAIADRVADRPRLAPALYGLGVVVLVLLALRTIWRNADWKDDLTIWSKTVETAPEAARARNNLGAAYLRRGQRARAQEQFEAAIRIKPDLAHVHANLGKIYLDREDLARAEGELVMALRLKRDEVIPRLWLGAVYVRGGRLAEAEQQFRAALSKPPFDAYAYNNLGSLLARSGRAPEAEAAFREALRRMPDLAEARENLVRLQRLRGFADRAGEPLERGAQ